MELFEISNKVFDMENSGKKVQPMHIGEIRKKTPNKIRSAAIKSLKKGETQYINAAGDLSLREKIADKHSALIKNVVITSGSKFALFATLKSLTNKGDQIAILSPHWPGINAICELNNLKLKIVETELDNNWSPTEEQINSLFKGGTKVIIIINPNNPTSTKLNKSIIEKIIHLAKLNKVNLIIDNAYLDLTFKKSRPLKLKSDNVFVIGSFSKSHLMTGWRIGFLVGNNKIIHAVTKILQNTISCVPKFVQDAALEALNDEETPKKLTKEFQEKAKIAKRELKGQFDFAFPDSGFYVFVRKKGLNVNSFCDHLLKIKRIALVPGDVFGNFKDFIRISLSVTNKKLEQNLRIIVDESNKF